MSSILFPASLRRVPYLLRVVIWFAAFLVGAVIVTLPFGDAVWPLYAWAALAVIYKVAAVDIPRTKNAGYSPWLLLLLCVPLANIYVAFMLFFAPQDS